VWATLLAAAAFAVLTPGCGGGGGGGNDGGSNNGAPSVVTGKVLDSRNGDAPVGGARVVIEGADPVTTTTVDQASADNQTGSFVIRGARVGANTAIITPPGGEPQTVGFDPPVGPGTNAPLELIINIGQLGGRLLDPAGQPVANALVTITATGDQAQTGADGRFRIDNIPTGSVEIIAVGSITVNGTAVVGVVQRTVNVGNGLTDAGDLTLTQDDRPTPGLPRTIAGKVTTADVANGGGGSLVTLFRDGVQVEQVTTDSQGNYFFYVPVGNYTVRVSKNGYRDADQPVNVTDPNATATVDVTLNPI
jgi:hypothetical protein